MKTIINIIILLVLSLPCAWVFSDSTGMMLIGLVYTFAYIENIVLPIYKQIK